ncbi:DUF1285 domain-containing protein [Ancylobacter dichloromethanicus]|uniref:DUF1285 domain-containing protein n=1 Tax=Ancylobacter dichloromethanicus TaxID=518825 RepID=UPI001BCA9B80|nr:DUF1285 domain-containing protein [Ancylobacter dichloromethanicus]MBS7553748.1 DUF1285 domain-containing protein [Ancylobacter dichloromethanicus]
MNSGASGRFDELVRSVGIGQGRALPAVESWNPPDCGEIDIVIDREGVWHHEGRPIRRPALVRLFASVLRREGARHVLVTPAEKLGITVEDAPFLAVEMAVEPGEGEPCLVFRTNLDDLVRCDRDHPLRVETRADGEPRPYLYVRRGLWARLTRAAFLDLAERAEARVVDGRAVFGVASGGAFFALAPAGTVQAVTVEEER